MNHEIRLSGVRVRDPFWSPRIDNVIERVIPYQWRVLNDAEPTAARSHAIENFRIAAGLAKGSFEGYQFQDSDLAKWMEAAAFSLIYRDDPQVRKQLTDMIDLIEKAQQPDGYMDTHFILKKPDRKWQELAHGHELYVAGHMLEAAVAYWQVTGSDRFLQVMDRLIDLIIATFGREEGKIDAYPGHEEIELALMKAYRALGDEKYLRLAEYFILNRGVAEGFRQEEYYLELQRKHRSLDPSYYQVHLPVLEQTTAEGHAVRAMYLYTGMADVALETGDQRLVDALHILWKNVTRRRMYITGGVGSQGHGERFTIDYDLPNDTCYTETCAAIGLAMWSLRMLRLEPDSCYADVMERALYNNVLSGISQDGENYFYVNPLMVKPDVAHFREDHEGVETQRVRWFGCACCPPNVIRTLTGLGSYLYTARDNRLYQHLFVGNTAEIELNGGAVKIDCESEMPWQGRMRVRVGCSHAFEYALRIPAYARDYTVVKNGEQARCAVKSGYAVLAVEDGDEIEVSFAMDAVYMAANPRVTEDCGKVCVLRGPLVYCAEEKDNGPLLQDLLLDTSVKPEIVPSQLLGGITAIRAAAWRSDPSDWQDEALYRPVSGLSRQRTEAILVPYCLWNNRGEGEMTVWFHRG